MSTPPLLLVDGRLALPDGPSAGHLRLDDGRIAAVGGLGTTEDTVVLDVAGLLVAPGLIDVQVNGAYGIDLTSELGEHPDRLWELARRLPEQGVTAFVPTVVSSPPQAVQAALAALQAAPADHLGAVPLGVHAEGPMLSPDKRGTHDPNRLRAPDPVLIEGWTRAAGLLMATIAPELTGALDVIAELVARDVVVSIGHSAATYEQARAGLDAGATAGTHLGNAMSGFSAREPGVIGALLADAEAVVGLIVDGVHLHPGTVAAVWRALGPDRIALVTDAIAAAGIGDGEAWLGGRRVTVVDGTVRDEEGRLAGSVVTLDRSLRELVAATGADVCTALQTATSTPAALLGDGTRGRLEVGARADLVVLTDDLEVVATFVGGRVAANPRPDLLDVAAAGLGVAR